MQPALKIRYGRTALALVGACALVAAVGLTVAALFGAVSGWAPLIALAVTALSVVILRTLAVRDRRSRMNAAFRDAMYSAPQQQKAPEQPNKDTELFDAEHGQEVAEVPPLSAEDLRQAALAVAAAAGDSAPTAGATWEPTEVPTPVYVQAPKAERPAPEPLRLPEAPKPEGKPTMKQAASEHRAATHSVAEDPRPTTGRINLDDVLQRRRA